jgi:hypothetical protein
VSEKSQNIATHFLSISIGLNKIIVNKNTGTAREVFKNNRNYYLINNPIVNNLAKKILIIMKNIESTEMKNISKLTFDN